MNRLLGSPLALHDVADIEAYCARIVERRLRRRNARLSPDQRRDLLGYLIATAWELSERYDPGVGTFSGYLSRFLPLRIPDWFRQEFGDSRYRDDDVREIVDTDNRELLDLADRLDVGAHVAERLSPLRVRPSDLTPRSQWILREIVSPIVEHGSSYEEIAGRHGYSRKWTERLLGELRRELESLEVAA